MSKLRIIGPVSDSGLPRVIRTLSTIACRFTLTILTVFIVSTAFAQQPELNVQTGHAGQVLGLAFTSDGKLLASGSVDKTIVIWNPATGAQLRVLAGHTGTVAAVAFSPDDTMLASGSADTTIKLWDVASGREKRRFSGHTLNITSIAFSPDGKLLASGSGDQTVKIWEVSTGRELHSLAAVPTPMPGLPISVAFSRDGKILASGGLVVKLWNVSTGSEIRTIRTTESNLPTETPVGFSYDGALLATGGSSVRLWEVATGKAVRTLPGDATVISLSSDRKTMAGTDRAEIKWWNISTGQEIEKVRGSQLGVDAVAFNPDGTILASGNSDNTITLWDSTTHQQVRVLKGHVAAISSLAVSGDDKVLASNLAAGVAGIGRRDTIKIWDPLTGQLVRSMITDHNGYSIGLSDDGSRLIAGSSSNTVSFWNVTQSQTLRTFSVPRGESRFVPDRVALSADGKVIAAGGRDNSIKLWDVSSGRELFTLKGHRNGIWDLAFNPRADILASSSADTSIKLWSVPAGRELRSLSAHSGGVGAIAFSAEGRRLASGGQDKMIVLWDVASGSSEAAYFGHQGWVNALAFSPDGSLLASASEDGEIRLWELPGPERQTTPVAVSRSLRILKGHVGRINSITFTAGGKLLLSGGSDASMKLWDVATGRELASLFSLDHHDWLVLTPDGLFDGSPAAWNQILWRFSSNLFDVAPVELFFNEYYYPGLLADLYAGKRPLAPQNIAQKDRRQPVLKLALAQPQTTVPISTRTVNIKLEIGPAPAGAQDVRLFRNGALVKIWRGDVLKGQPRIILDAQIPIVAGPNQLNAYAFNRDNVKSADATLNIVGGDNLKQPGTLYLFTIAVNKYANSQFDLRYAVADATDFSVEVGRQEAKLKNFGRTETISLSDTQATKANILKALADLAAKVKPEDAVVIYYAGHGTAQQNQFYLIPHDLGYMGPRNKLDAASLKAVLLHSISDRELERAFEGIDAGQFLLVIDACNSGQALEAEEKRRGPMNSKGLAQLAYEKGIYILTAAQSYQAALEPSDLKHGLLTYALVEEGLKQQAADAEPQDGTLSAREWFSYVMRRVPELQEQRMLQASQAGRQLVYVEGQEATAAEKRDVQRPRVFYRRELEERPFTVAVFSATPPQ